MVAYLVDTWDWTSLESELVDYLELTPPLSTRDELVLKALLAGALRAGDVFMNNPWQEDSDGDPVDPEDYATDPSAGTDVTPPDDVKLGVFEHVKRRWFDLSTTGSGGAGAGMEVTSRKTGDLTETYGWAPSGAGSEGGGSENPSGFLPNELWRPYRMRRLL